MGFTTAPGQWEPPRGDFLGDLTDETAGNSITHLVVKKNYAFKLANANKPGNLSVCKVRGITLYFKNALDINFDTAQKMVTGKTNEDSVTVIDENDTVRDPESCKIRTKIENKEYRTVFELSLTIIGQCLMDVKEERQIVYYYNEICCNFCRNFINNAKFCSFHMFDDTFSNV